MNFIFALLFFTTFLLAVQGQCVNAPSQPKCKGPRRLGISKRGCHTATRWWYDTASKSCKSFKYRGCGGNDNRFCSKDACEERCKRN